VKTLNIEFLMTLTEEPQVLTGREIEALVLNVLSILRVNRGVGRLSDEEVRVGNQFVLAMNFLFMDCEDMRLGVTEEDIDYIMAENNYMRMGTGRN